MSITKVVALLVGVALLALVAVGCGSSDDDTGSTESEATLTKAEFVKQANAICKAGNDEIEAAIEEDGEPKNEAEGEEFIEETVLPAVANQVEEISELGYPEGKDGEEAEAIVASAEENVEEAEEGDPTA